MELNKTNDQPPIYMVPMGYQCHIPLKIRHTKNVKLTFVFISEAVEKYANSKLRVNVSIFFYQWLIVETVLCKFVKRSS